MCGGEPERGKLSPGGIRDGFRWNGYGVGWFRSNRDGRASGVGWAGLVWVEGRGRGEDRGEDGNGDGTRRGITWFVDGGAEAFLSKIFE